MRILTKYLGTTIISYVLLVMLFLLGLHAFIDFMHEFSSIGTGSYGIKQVLGYVALMLPTDVYQFFPMAGLLGCVIALGLLASHSELIIMRAAGMSLVDIARDVAYAALFLIGLMFIVGEVVGPMAQAAATRHKAMAMSGGQALVTYQGIWLRSGKDFIHIDTVAGNGELQNVTRYEFAEGRTLKTASVAARGSYDNGKWVFKDIIQTNFSDSKVTNVTVAQQEWELVLNPSLLGITHVDADQKSILKLYSYIKGRKLSGLNADSYEFNFWNRIFTPLATLIMILLAVPFVFGPLRSSTMGLRMLIGVIIGFGFHILNQFVGSISVVSQVPPFFAAILPSLVFMAIGGLLLAKTR